MYKKVFSKAGSIGGELLTTLKYENNNKVHENEVHEQIESLACEEQYEVYVLFILIAISVAWQTYGPLEPHYKGLIGLR